jgi:predicted NBD/HSP70 family sugar kinase
MRTGVPGAALRDVNRSAVLRLIGRFGPISRADIARRAGVSPGTVTTLVRNLLDAGVVTPIEQSTPRTGRPAELVGLVGSAAQAIGVKVASDHLAIVRADLDGTVLAATYTPFDAVGANPFTLIAEHLEAHVAAADGDSVLLGIGLGLPGFEDPHGSGVVQSPLLGWRNLPLGEHLSRTLGLPVLVDNDVNTLAVAESLYGTGRGFDHFLVVTLGEGVGMGIVVDGEPYRGGRGAAGELGHVAAGGDRPCSCGKRGCLETVIAEPALLAMARRRRIVGAADGPDQLVAKAAAGNRRALDLYAAAGAALGDALASAAVVLDPQAVVVAGEGTRGWAYMEAAFAARFAGGVFPPARDRIPVFVDEWDDTAWALGAAALVLRAPFATPLHEHPAIEVIRGRLDAGFQAPLAALRSTAGGRPR